MQTNQNPNSRPPLGITPRFIWLEHRLDDLKATVRRHTEAGLLPNTEWLKEIELIRNELIQREIERGRAYRVPMKGSPSPSEIDMAWEAVGL